MDEYAGTAYLATGVPDKSVSSRRRVLEQQDAIVTLDHGQMWPSLHRSDNTEHMMSYTPAEVLHPRLLPYQAWRRGVLISCTSLSSLFAVTLSVVSMR